ncbi:MAG: hypothetical protein ACYCRH_00335 [Acidiferrobacteraceae bacterium]
MTSVSVYDLVYNVLHPGHLQIVAFHMTLSRVASVSSRTYRMLFCVL